MDQPLPQPAPEGPTPGEPTWSRVLAGRSPREVLARLVDGDPLDLRPRCELRVRSQAVLLDIHRLHLRTAAHVARHGPNYNGTPPIDVWIAERIRKAAQELLQEDAELAASGAIPEPPEDERLLLVANTLGMDPALMGRACAAFNRAPYDARAAFQGLVLDAQDPSTWCKSNSMTIERAMASLRTALWALGVREELDLDDLLRGGDDGA